MTAQAESEKIVIDLPAARNAYLLALAGVSVALILSIGLLLMLQKLPIFMTATLVVVAAGCAGIIVVIADQLLGARLTVDENFIVVSRLVGGATYPWPKVEDIKVVAPTNSLADDPFADQAKRLGLGLFIANSGRIRESDLDADVILCAMPDSKVETLMGFAERLKKMRPTSGFRQASASGPPKIGAKRPNFRRRGAKVAAP